ncbi:MAG: DUF4197 family protein [Bacteroidales bacterium]|nr:DUF4197 family protein [Bacteroidales bacterium]
MMKKFQFLCLAVLCAMFFSSCKDDSGTYAEQLFTNSEKAAAVKACLNSSLDTAVAHLCTSGGFSEYKDGLYMLDFSANRSMMDTLAAHGFGNLSDSLIFHANRMAESCNSVVKTAFEDAIDNLVVYDYDALIKGGDYAITDYFAEMKSNTLKDAMRSQVQIRMNVFGVDNSWNEMANQYYQITNQPVTYDVQGYILEKMLNGILEEMRCEEYMIRNDETHRVSADSLLGL